MSLTQQPKPVITNTGTVAHFELDHTPFLELSFQTVVHYRNVRWCTVSVTDSHLKYTFDGAQCLSVTAT